MTYEYLGEMCESECNCFGQACEKKYLRTEIKRGRPVKIFEVMRRIEVVVKVTKSNIRDFHKLYTGGYNFLTY